MVELWSSVVVVQGSVAKVWGRVVEVGSSVGRAWGKCGTVWL